MAETTAKVQLTMSLHKVRSISLFSFKLQLRNRGRQAGRQSGAGINGYRCQESTQDKR
jgi:hypothetical protein